MSALLDQTVQLLRLIKSRSKGRSYERGEEYHREERITDLTRERRGWSGIAHGLNEYDVWIDPEKGMYECNCPASAPCKHVVALTLALIDHLPAGDDQRRRPSPTRPERPNGNRKSVASRNEGPLPRFVLQFKSGSDRFWLSFRDASGKRIIPTGIDDLLHWLPPGMLDFYYRQREEGLSIPYQFESISRHIDDIPLFLDDEPVAAVNRFPLSFALVFKSNSGSTEAENTGILSASASLSGEDEALWERRGAFLLARKTEGKTTEIRLALPSPDQLPLLQRTGIRYPLKTLLELLPEMRLQQVSGIEALPDLAREGPMALLFVDPITDREDLIGLHLQFRFAYFDHEPDPEKDTDPLALQNAAVFAPYSIGNLPRQAEAIAVSPEQRPAMRNVHREKEILKPLQRLLTQNGNRRVYRNGILPFFDTDLAEFQQAGVSVQMPAELTSLNIRLSASVLQLQASSRTDWFGGRVEIPGLSSEDVEHAIAAARAKQSHLRLGDGHWIRLEDLQIDRLLRTMDSLGLKSRRDGTIEKISAGQATALLAEQEARTERLTEELRSRLLRWSQAGSSEMPVLEDGFSAKLRSYQLTGASFLLERHAAGIGGILADDMGLGKTVQGLAFLHTLFREKPGRYLIVCPPAALSVWRHEVERFCPHILLQLWHGNARKDQFPASTGIVLTTYGTLQKDHALLGELPFDTVLVDEAQALKNHRSTSSRSMRSLQSRTFFCLTGTPLENHPLEIWSLMDLILPGLLGTVRSFRSLFAQNLEQEQRDSLKRRIAPFFLRRTRDAVLKDLPARTVQDLRVPMTQKQALAYEQSRREAIDVLQTAGRDYLMQMLPHLMKLRRIACHHGLGEKDADPLESGKILAYAEMAEELEETARGILVFSQFTDMLDLFERYLIDRKQSYLRLDGATTAVQRERRVRQFQEGQIPYFLISLRAGGTALTLHRADTVLHLDPWWNPAVEEQATARAHRMGQKHPVFVYRFFSENSVEEKVEQLQQKKRQLFDELFGSSQKSAVPFGRDELESLLMMG